MTSERHSEQYLKAEARDFWWNFDFLELIARRWSLRSVSSVLDVGCGLGHWGQTLLPHLGPEVSLTGVEREPTWVRAATARARARGFADRVRYVEGVAEQIPFADAEFDLVTCQTLLLHTRDPLAVIKEMARVTKPGGRLLLVEPVNMANSLMLGSTRFFEDVETTVRLLRFELTCYRGKEKVGEGNNSVGSLLPKLLADAGLQEIAAYQNDKAALVIPPYATDESRAIATDSLEWAEKDVWIWSRPETLRYFLAGGGRAESFDAEWDHAVASNRAVANGLRSQTEYSIGTGVTYLASAVKR